MNAYGIAEQLLQKHSCIPRLCDHLHPDVHLQSPVLSLVTLCLLKFKRFDFLVVFLCIIRIHISISVSYFWWCPPFIRTHRINIHKHMNISKKSKSLQILFWFINKSYFLYNVISSIFLNASILFKVSGVTGAYLSLINLETAPTLNESYNFMLTISWQHSI